MVKDNEIGYRVHYMVNEEKRLLKKIKRTRELADKLMANN